MHFCVKIDLFYGQIFLLYCWKYIDIIKCYVELKLSMYIFVFWKNVGLWRMFWMTARTLSLLHCFLGNVESNLIKRLQELSVMWKYISKKQYLINKKNIISNYPSLLLLRQTIIWYSKHFQSKYAVHEHEFTLKSSAASRK